MITKYLGIKEFRQNMAKYVKAARRHGWRYVVSSRSEPLFEVKVFSPSEAILVRLAIDIAKARQQVRNGTIRGFDKIFRMLEEKRKVGKKTK